MSVAGERIRAVLTDPARPGGGPPWRRLVLGLVLGLAITVVLGLLMTLIGFRVHFGFFVLLVPMIIAAVWLGTRVVRPAHEVVDPDPVLDVVHLHSRNADQRVRKLEEFLYGSQPRYNLASNELRAVLATLVNERIAAGADVSAVSPQLRAYLTEPKAPPLNRRALHQIIKEIAAL